ncbi:ejaculatory bulb-specific protein 3-like isoform X2 [Harmonia axyridis]|uniref:ejaculatory bulb-specific protein 3-like isoform X2 n=1 Tax=Harmonia axyridis TaxID=115357 RepID=UPI001E27562E|nr:ejaculatory bulb-specific protein 3-like isoform X2 [Harmonia axyridis]
MLFVLLVVVAAAINVAHSEEGYSSKLENIDVDAIIKNERLLQNHFKCLIDGQGCTPEAEELKKNIPEIMETCCAKCSDKHKEAAKKMTEYLLANKPELIKKVLDKYDPERKYTQKCNEQLKSGGVDLSGI